MKYLFSQRSSKAVRFPWWFIGLLCCITSIAAYLLSWKTNGVLENTMHFNMYPLGYTYHYITEHFGVWPLNRETDFYLQSLQGFLGVSGSYLNVGSGYEVTRTMYPFALQSFWFLEPVMAFLAFDVLMWVGAILCAFYVACHFGGKNAGYLAAFFTFFGHGFLLSVGEGVGHVWGYAGGFYIIALMVHFRTWDIRCRLASDALVYALISVMILGYGTALFYVPIALCASLCRLFYQNDLLWIKLRNLLVLLFVVFLPVAALSIVLRWFGLSGDSGFLIQLLLEQNTSFIELVQDYVFIFFDVVLSLGPLFWAFFPISLWVFFSTPNYVLKLVIALVWLQFAAMTLVLLPVPGRGYAAFNLASMVIVFMSIYLQSLWRYAVLRVLIVGFLGVYALYPFSNLWGQGRLTSQLFQLGLASQKEISQGYDIVILK